MKRISLLIALILVTVACSDSSESTTTAATADSTTTEAVQPSSTVAENGRTIQTVGCAEAPEQVAIVCEAYDLISRNYVDEISDLELAEAALAGVIGLDGSTADDELICVLPAATFTGACEALADEAETSFEGAEAMVRGMAAALDPNSLYLDEDSVSLIEEEQEGQIEGIGALVTAEDSAITDGNQQCSIISATCRLIIVSTIDESPAESSGILRDDVIVGVDGQDITGWTLDEVTAAVRGPAGTDVLLEIARDAEVFEVNITRAAVVIPVVDSEVFGDIGYAKLNIFNDNADEQLAEALQELLDEQVEEIVFDLRDNPGGLLDTAIEVTSLFLEDGGVVVTQGPEGERVFEVTGEVLVPEGIPVTIIINRGSASASEVVAAVMQEVGRATVVGENSFGKNTVQQRFSLTTGGAFKVTIARWLTPGGLDFGSEGVVPDVLIDFDPELDTEAIATQAAEAS